MKPDYPFKHRLLYLAQADRLMARTLGDDHPTLSAQREANARELELIVDEDGWPTVDEAGEDGTEAALLIALHATSRPNFQRRCLTMMKGAANRGDLPAGQVERMEAALEDEPQDRPAAGPARMAYSA